MLFENEIRIIDSQKASWDHFASDIKFNDFIGVVYHSDGDGLVGALYASRSVEHLVDSKIFYHWITNAEFDFVGLFEFIKKTKINKLIIVDISIENYRHIIDKLKEQVDQVFIFDHHIVTDEKALLYSSPIYLMNPTLNKALGTNRPIPTFLFAYYLALNNDIVFPDWLLLISIFSEGLDDRFKPEVEILFQKLNIVFQGDLRSAYWNSRFAVIASYIKTEFNGGIKSNFNLLELQKCIESYPDDFKRLEKNLEKKLKLRSQEINNSINNTVRLWESLLELSDYKIMSFVLIPIENKAIIEGPVASILRGNYPKKIFASFKIYRDKVIYEFRTSNSSPVNIVNILGKINNSHPNILINYGGHPSACGCSILIENLGSFNDILKNNFEHL